ncbi:hypothetical protein WN51_10617 [Melipona quadrifasciata]|uniref:Uncharacterized protein n=1 Tax=Melipona quadrifasciata TaxID=166423 RepID=A0A0N0U2K1_9HYME|nr:hypothetical protein WN51_10617 [Melipona quadrifasciata]
MKQEGKHIVGHSTELRTLVTIWDFTLRRDDRPGLPHFANYPTTVRHDLCGEPPPARFCTGQDLWFSEDAAPLHLKRNKLSVQGILVAHCNSHTVTPCVLLAQVATAFFYADITREVQQRDANQAAMPMPRDASFARASSVHARSRPRLSSTGAVVHAARQRHQATLRVGSQGGQGQEFLGVRECLAHIATSRSPETSQSFLEAVHQRPQGRSCSLKRTLSKSLLGSFLLSCDCLSEDTILDR